MAHGPHPCRTVQPLSRDARASSRCLAAVARSETGFARQGPFEERNAKEHKEQRCGTIRRTFDGHAGLWAIPSTTLGDDLSKWPQPLDPKSSQFFFPTYLA